MKKKLLILLFLASFSTYAQTNLVPNGNFETWTSSSQPDNWFRYFSGFASQSTSAQNGKSSTNMMIASGTFNYINSEYFPVVANKTYRVTLYHKLVSGSFSAIDLSLYHKPGTFKEEIIKKTDATVSNSQWRKIEFDYTPTISENIEVDIWTTGTLNSEILVDNVSVIDVATIGAQYTLIPDVNFEKSLIILGIDGVQDGKVLTSKIANVKNLDLSDYYTDLKILDLTGIQDFSSLEVLKLSYNNNREVTSIDLSKNLLLKIFDCKNNKLTSLDVSKNLFLSELYCQNNKITSLNLSQNKELTKLDCSSNRLTSIDLSQNIALTTLDCSTNRLTILNVGKNKALTHLTSNGSSKDDSTIIQQGLLTSIDLSQNIALEYLDFKYNEKVVGFDVSKNKNLLYLNVDRNGLTNIDFSANTLLKTLSCEANKLTSLDVSKYPALETLVCDFNQIKSIDVSQKITLKHLSISGNQLISLDISKNLALERLYCDTNQLTNLDLSMNPNLIQLLCSANQLTYLDLSMNSKLFQLYCSNNKLVKLNLKNGNNSKMNAQLSFVNNPSLFCILVDDFQFSNTNWKTYKDTWATFNTECNFSLPANNFNVESKGETCLNSNNGEINITATAIYTYKASINGTPYSFTNNSLKVPNLTPGTYTVSITITGETFEQSFTVVIPKGASITGKSSIAANKVSIEITEGTAPYTVFVDGIEQFETTDTNFTVDTKKGGLLQVKTAKACEGIYAKEIAGLVSVASAYPNPTSGSFEIELPSTKKEVVITLYTLDGQMISTKTYTVENGKAQLSLENQPSGVYVAKIELDTPDYLKIIKN
jgi:hypothetical protein